MGARGQRARQGLVGDPDHPARGARRAPAGQRLHRLRRDHPDPGRRRGGHPVLSPPPGGPVTDPEELGAALREALPGEEPFEVDAGALAAAVAAAGADPDDDRLVAAALVAWESLL